MPTDMYWFRQAAKKFADVDPKDDQAVGAFWENAYKTLSKDKQVEVMDYLFGHEGAPIPEGEESGGTMPSSQAKPSPGIKDGHVPVLVLNEQPIANLTIGDEPYWGSLRGKTIVGGVIHDGHGIPERRDPPPMEEERDRPPLFPHKRRPPP